MEIIHDGIRPLLLVYNEDPVKGSNNQLLPGLFKVIKMSLLGDIQIYHLGSLKCPILGLFKYSISE